MSEIVQRRPELAGLRDDTYRPGTVQKLDTASPAGFVDTFH